MVAAAVVGGAGVVVTDNLRDFPRETVPRAIHVVTAAQFASDAVSVSPTAALSALGVIAERLRRPPMTVEELLDVLASRYRWHEAVELLRETM